MPVENEKVGLTEPCDLDHQEGHNIYRIKHDLKEEQLIHTKLFRELIS